MQPTTKTPAPISRHTGFLAEPLVLGTICGFGSAIGYTAANICLRAVSDVDPIWVSSIKAVPTVILFGPWLLFTWWRHGVPSPPWRPLGILVITALICQLFGNVAFQWALGVIGIALVVPIMLGTMIISGALMGRVFLHESVTPRTAFSIVTLLLAICVLSLGAEKASQSILPAGSTATVELVAAGVGIACLSGLAYSLLGVVIRYSVTGKVSITGTIVTVTLTGVLALGAMSFWTVGWAGMLATSGADFATMALAGFFNALAFVTLTKSLQLVPLVYVNALNATQATMAALAGIAFFAEPQSAVLWLGVSLTVVGLLLIQQRRQPVPIAPVPIAKEPSDAPVPPASLEPATASLAKDGFSRERPAPRMVPSGPATSAAIDAS